MLVAFSKSKMTSRQNKYYATYLYILLLALFSPIKGEFKCWTPPSGPLRHANEPYRLAAVSRLSTEFRITPLYTEVFERLSFSALLKERVVQYALDYWKSALKPKSPLKGPLRISRGCINDEFELRKESDGQYYEYCLKGCNPNPTCYTTPIPKQYLDKCRVIINGQPQIIEDVGGPGIPNTDFALIVDATRVSACDEGVLAFATICQADYVLDRPTFGYVNFCDNHVGLEYPDLVITRKTAMHEIAHALGFSPMMYAYMRKENGDPRTPRNNKTGTPNLGRTSNGIFIASPDTIGYAIRNWQSVGGSYNLNRTLLKTPKLVEFAKSHFGCTTLDGVELESQGGDGTASAHFEKRIVLNELMAGSIGFDVVVSGLTLSYFQDSGWYHVDMSKAQTYLWAQKVGCSFMFDSCYQYMQQRIAMKQSVWPWCNDLSETDSQCLTYDNAYGRCNLVKHSTRLPAYYQYFNSLPGVSKEMLPYYGGQDGLTEFCPYVTPQLLVKNGPSTYCGHSENDKYVDKRVNRQLQNYGSDARCFNHDPAEAWKSYQCGFEYQIPAVAASCHRYKCVSGQGLIIVIGSKEFFCPLNGGSIQVGAVGKAAYVKGKIICPKCSEVCTNCPASSNNQITAPDGVPANVPCPAGASTSRQSKVLLFLVSLLFLGLF